MIEFVPPELQEQLRDRLAQLEQGRATEPFEHRIVRLDGEERIVVAQSVPITYKGQQAAQTVIRDVTERRRYEDRLQGCRQKIEALYEVTSRLLTATSLEAVSDCIHEVLQDVFDYSFANTGFVEEVIVPERTRTDDALQIPPPKPEPIEGNSMSAQVCRAEETLVFEDTGALDNDVGYGDLRSAVGVPIGTHGVVIVGDAETGGFDPFDLRLIEVLASYAALVLDRLDRLDREKEMVEAKEKAERMNRMKSAFLANMSHEIRTPRRGSSIFSKRPLPRYRPPAPPPNRSDASPSGRARNIPEAGGLFVPLFNSSRGERSDEDVEKWRADNGSGTEADAVRYAQMLDHLHAALKPGGRLVMGEYIDDEMVERDRETQVEDYDLAMRYAREELRQAGFKIVREVDTLRYMDRHDSRFWMMVATRPTADDDS